MQVKLEPTSDDDYDLAYSSTGSAAATDDRKPGAGSADDDDDDDDDEFEEVGLDAGPTSAPLASRQADDEEHPALILRRQQEAEEAAAAAASATGGEGADAGAAAARPVFRDGKGGNRPPIEVQIAVPEELELKGKGKKKARTYTPEERLARLNAHKVHLVSLLSSALSLNRQTTSPILQARLLSLLPPSLTSAFAAITSTNMPVRTTRGRAFERALEALVDWWSSEWEVDWRAGIRYRTWAEAEEMGRALDEERETVRKSLNPAVASSSKGGKVDRKGKGRATVAPPAAPPISKKAAKKLLDALGKAQGGELLRSHKSLQKKALQLAGSRDIGAILFVACCRALGIGARVVVSLQPVGWRMGDGSASTSASKAKGKGKGKAQATTDDDDDDVEMEPVALPTPAPTSAAGTASTSTPAGTTNGGYVRWIDRPPSQRVPGLKSTLGAQLGGYGAGSPGQTLDGKVGTGNPATGAGGSARSKWRSKGRKVGEKSTDPNAPFDVTTPPIYWAEIFSRPDQEWIPVDPIRGFIRRLKDFEAKGSKETARNRMVYVLGMEEDNTVKDLTAKYCESAGGLEKALKQRVPVLKAPRGGGEEDFWGDLVRVLGRDYKLARDVQEDDLLQKKVRKKVGAMPTTMEGFKNHPDFVLERHVTTMQVIHPKIQHSLFKGEPVYRRANVHTVKAEAGWLREGREVKHGEEPMKWGKVRAMTKQRQRELEAEKERTGEEVRQPLYSKAQTRLVRPPPVKDGYIPRNQYGNMDLFVPTMLPPGAVHLKMAGIGKTAKKLDISYADACVDFQFKQKQKKAIPVLQGIVVAEENVEALLEAHKEAQAIEEEKARVKQRERVLKGWERLITGLKIRRRMQREYGNGETGTDQGIPIEVDLGVRPHEMPSHDKHFHRLLPAEGGTTDDERLPLSPRVKQEPVEARSDGGGFLVDSDDGDGDEQSVDDDDEIQIVERSLNPRSLASLHAQDDGDGDSDDSDPDGEGKPSRIPPFAAPTSAVKASPSSTPRVTLRRPTIPAAEPSRRPQRAAAARMTSAPQATPRISRQARKEAAKPTPTSSARKRTRAELMSDSGDGTSSDLSVEEGEIDLPARPARPTRAAAAKGQLKMKALELEDSSDDE